MNTNKRRASSVVGNDFSQLHFLFHLITFQHKFAWLSCMMYILNCQNLHDLLLPRDFGQHLKKTRSASLLHGLPKPPDCWWNVHYDFYLL
jgi:hypothetical protein